MNLKWAFRLVAIGLILILAACGSTSESTEQPGGSSSVQPEQQPAPETEPNDSYAGEPVEIIIKDQNTAIASDENIGNLIIELVQNKYPEISLKLVRTPIDEMIMTGQIPDMVAASPSALLPYIHQYDYPADLTDGIRALNIDLSKIEPLIVETIQRFSDDGEFFGLPFAMNHGATIYNQDIFDMFGQEFPEHVMTWDEFYELSAAMTQVVEGVQYVGGAPAWTIVNQFRQYGASTIDETGERANLQSQEFQDVFRLLEKFYAIPGLVNEAEEKYAYGNNDFFKDQILAMYTGYMASHLNQLINNPPTYEWDLGAFPVYEGQSTGNPLDFHMLTVSKVSDKKEAAYRVMEALLTPEAQTAISKAGRITVLTDPDIKSVYAENSGIFKGKNLEAVFSVPNSPLVESDFSIYRDAAAPILRDTVKEVALQKTDINSALRTANEKANAAIELQKQGAGN